MHRSPRISVIGAGSCGPETEHCAREVGRLIAENGAELVCGGLDGVMRAACQGAFEAGGLTIGILPGQDPSEANPYVRIPIATSLSHMRNYLVILNGDVVIAVEGSHGTLSELALARKSGKVVVALGKWSGMEGVVSADSPEDAVQKALAHLPA